MEIIGDKVGPYVWKGNQQNTGELARFTCPMEARIEVRKCIFSLSFFNCHFLRENGRFLDFAGEDDTGKKTVISIEMTIDEAKELNLI